MTDEIQDTGGYSMEAIYSDYETGDKKTRQAGSGEAWSHRGPNSRLAIFKYKVVLGHDGQRLAG